MILTTRRQQRVLAAMHKMLRESDPRLVGTFGAFTRLAADEAIPAIERVRGAPLRWLIMPLRWLIMPLRWLIMPLRWLIMPLRWLLAPFRRLLAPFRRLAGPLHRVVAWHVTHAGPRRSGPRRGLLQGAVFIPLAAAALLMVMLVLALGGPRASCAPPRASQITARATPGPPVAPACGPGQVLRPGH